MPRWRNALVVMSIAVAMASLFAASYVLALGRLVLHQVPAAVVGDPTSPGTGSPGEGQRRWTRSAPRPVG